MAMPEPKDLSHHLSRATKRRQGSQVKNYYKYFGIPGIGPLAAGHPNCCYFPFDTLEAKTALPDRWAPTPNGTVDLKTSLNGRPATRPESHVVVPQKSSNSESAHKIDLKSALQYGPSQGYRPLYSFLHQFVRQNLHPHVPYAGGPNIILTCGSTDGLSKALIALNNEWSEGYDATSAREGILCEEYAYMDAIQQAVSRGLNITPVKVDDEGMCAAGPGGLRDVLENWDFSQGKIPHLMYTVTIGQNPTGGSLSVERRKAVYELCVQYDIIIIEDDPYWHLQYPSSNNFPPVPKPVKSSGFEYLDSLVPSYLSLDYQGRVLRLDTFSKTIAPGCRMGWITAQPALVQRISHITDLGTQQPSGFVQGLVAELIVGPGSEAGNGRGGAEDGRGWEVTGWVRWLEGLRGEYERRMNKMCDILDEGQYEVKSSQSKVDGWQVVEKTELFYYIRPPGGMFVWLRFHFNTHPLYGTFSGEDLSHALWLFWTTEKFRVVVAPGKLFAPTAEIAKRDAWECFRLCFVEIEEADLEPVTKRFVMGIKAYWRIRTKDVIRKLLDEDETVTANAKNLGMVNLTGFGC
ncbi:aromatic amino acid aminotransferas-like protein [Rhizodiscina lignyota]|uniref:Aromatic amino acid aminotransferas-like protein n=1 Tax=Rhizodiscina lignyota TaxID=1504668 RepID=A0A9P4IHJ4_9PEZI|nr:aromatic amino acid aminotransferas-like protein [Rhizodiscina lignyota]